VTVLVVLFFLLNLAAFGGVGVTSQEQFSRLDEAASPENVKYNFERAYLEARASEKCPAYSKAFFSVHINKKGEVEGVKGRIITMSADLKGLAMDWAHGLIKQMRFRPLMYGKHPSAVDMPVTLVCSE
jgi:hypothetical protein